MKNIEQEVLICGAGPAGMLSALILNRFGVKSTIIDKREERSQWSKAGTIQPRTLELLDDLGLIDRFLDSGKIISKNNLYDGAKKINILDYRVLSSKYNYLLAIPQFETERILEEALRAEGILIHRGYELKDLEYNMNRIILSIQQNKTDEIFKKEACYLIAADGGRSTVRTLLVEQGEVMLKESKRYFTNFIMGDFEIEGFPFSTEERHTHFAKKHLVTFIPMPGNTIRVVAMQHKKYTSDQIPTKEEFSELIEHVLGLKLSLKSEKWLSRFYPARFIVNNARIGNIFLIGDAAHIVSPISAQGINMAMEEAYNLGWKISMAITEKVQSKILATYFPERSIPIKKILDHSDKNQSMVASTIGNILMRQLIRLGNKEKEKEKIINQLSLFNVDYEGVWSPLKSKKSQSLVPGTRLYNAPVDLGEKKEIWLFDFLPYEAYTLLVNSLSKEFMETDSEAFRRHNREETEMSILKVTQSLNDEREENIVCLDSASKLAKQLRESHPYLLIRPDKFVSEVYPSGKLENILSEHCNALTIDSLVLI